MVFMDPKSLEKDLFIDLESGKHAVVNEVLSEDSCSSVELGRQIPNKFCSEVGSDSGLLKGEEHTSVQYYSLSLSDGSSKNVDDIGRKSLGGEEKMVHLEKVGAEKPRKKKCKKPPRPPRPPSLDSTEQKLAKEISELAMLKRARIERMKALKNMKNAKQAASNNSLCALVITVLFCLVIVWQGVFSRDLSSLSFHGSPESSHEAGASLISVQFYKNISASPNIVEQAYGVDVHKGAESDGH
ncbi:hypothetical protein IHE45_07G012100 [Dioscorea alata]|uniref:Uncharacterized protein n=2 Tax=Dioscorea alata TaxID=55571 RepID=A0ACB7VPM4_DIOAL|nr:hypothetical protein IHE45_07G012100 [Dioscorea alata]KAH7676389.1 hypothetical protein IHE45_07G012100 [Dioscorea alata]